MNQQELTPYIGQRIKHVGPHSTECGTLTRLTERTADFVADDGSLYHTEIYRVTPAHPAA